MLSRRTKPRRFLDAVHRDSVRVDISGRVKFTTGRKFCAFGLALGPRNAKLHRDGSNPFAAIFTSSNTSDAILKIKVYSSLVPYRVASFVYDL